MNSIYSQIAAIGKTLNAERVVLYGSRARGDNRERSDIDIAVFGLSGARQNAFVEQIEALPTLLDFDLVFVTCDTDERLLSNIEKDGIVLMDKTAEKFGKLMDATNRLAEAIDEYAGNQSDVVRDGVIQRFEFCTELAWKVAREYLIDQGYTEINSPKATMKQAYADGIIADEEAWIALLNDRNLTSHLYDDSTAGAVFERIRLVYLQLFRALIEKVSMA